MLYEQSAIGLVSREFPLRRLKSWDRVFGTFSVSWTMYSWSVCSYLPPAQGRHWWAMGRVGKIGKCYHRASATHSPGESSAYVLPLYFEVLSTPPLWTWERLSPIFCSVIVGMRVWAWTHMRIICVFAESVPQSGEGSDYTSRCPDQCKAGSVPLERHWNREKYSQFVCCPTAFIRIQHTSQEPWSLPSVKLVTRKDVQEASNY